LRTSTARGGIASDTSTQPIARSGGPGGPEHLPEGTRVVIALREPPGLLSRHTASDQGLTESLDASFPARLESEEPHAEAHGHDRDPRDQAVQQGGHLLRKNGEDLLHVLRLQLAPLFPVFRHRCHLVFPWSCTGWSLYLGKPSTCDHFSTMSSETRKVRPLDPRAETSTP